jgi:hypothetical protein
MTAQPHRPYTPDHRESVLHELQPLRLANQSIPLRLSIRRSDDGAWCGRLHFIAPDCRERETAEIFRAESEAELWQAVRGLRDHHIRALYQSLV